MLQPDRVIDPAILASYAGTYQLSPSFAVKVRFAGKRLVAQAGEQPEVELVPAPTSSFTRSKALCNGTAIEMMEKRSGEVFLKPNDDLR